MMRWPRRRRQPDQPPARREDGLRLPQFLVIGAQKAGTTWLHQLLGARDDVFMPHPKELHFFDKWTRYRRGLAWYAAHFGHAPDDAVLGEATPSYLWVSDHRSDTWALEHFDAVWRHSLPERVVARLGADVPLVAVLRDPVARAVSAFYHNLRAGNRIDTTRPFAETATRYGIVHRGFYAAHLQRWFEVYPRERILVLLFEEVMQHPQKALDRVCDHIGLDRRRTHAAQLAERVHRGDKHLGDDGQYYLDESLEQVAITHSDLDMLRELYAPENARLAHLLDRDLSVWRG